MFFNIKPTYLGTVSSVSYDGTTDDLLTAGLGKTGLGGVAPVVLDPLKPTAAELRKLAIFNNYRAILDITAANVPPIKVTADAADRITFANNVVTVAD